MNVKKNVFYLFISVIVLLFLNVVCRSLMLAGVISMKNGGDIIQWGSLLLLVPIVMVLSRFTMFSRKFYISIISLSVYVFLFAASHVLPAAKDLFFVLGGVMGNLMAYSALSGTTKMFRELMSKQVYKKTRKAQNIIGTAAGAYLLGVSIIIFFAKDSLVLSERVSQFLFVPGYVMWIVVLLLFCFVTKKLGFASLYKTMNIVELNALNEEMILKTKVTEAMTKNFLSCGVFRLKEDDFRIIYAVPYVRTIIEKYSSARDSMDASIEAFTDQVFKDRLREFLDCSTIQERLKNKSIISTDFVGDRMGKCRASLLPISWDEDGEVSEVLYTVQHISKELLSLQEQLVLEETVIRCVSIVTQTSDFDAAINRLLATVGDYYSADRAYIFDIDYENNKVRNTYEWCKEGIEPMIGTMQNMELGDWYRWIDEFKRNGLLSVSNRKAEFSEDAFEYRLMSQQGVEKLLAVPTLDTKGKINGFIGVDNPSERAESEMLMKSISAFVETERREERHKTELYDLSHKDLMTGCFNRHAYNETIELLNRTKAQNIGVVFADVNGLKRTNDTYGHEKGDELLMEAANIIKTHFPFDDVYRIGGDEFVVFCADIAEAEFGLVFQRLLDKLKNKELFSIGKIWIAQCQDIEKQIHIADENMYSMKQEYYNNNNQK